MWHLESISKHQLKSRDQPGRKGEQRKMRDPIIILGKTSPQALICLPSSSLPLFLQTPPLIVLSTLKLLASRLTNPHQREYSLYVSLSLAQPSLSLTTSNLEGFLLANSYCNWYSCHQFNRHFLFWFIFRIGFIPLVIR